MSSIRKRVWTARGIERSAWIVDYRSSGKASSEDVRDQEAGGCLVGVGAA